jgi:hypothetical protein
MMFLQPLSMNFVFQAMLDAQKARTEAAMNGRDLDEFINTNAPVIVQIGDFGYVVTGCGGDSDLENFVLSVADEPVCEWVDGECIKLNGDD